MSSSNRVLGSLGELDGKGFVRLQDRYDTDPADLWSALTEPHRLARWLADVSGDLRPGGQFTAHFFASGWTGTHRVTACEPPRHLLMLAVEEGAEEEHTVEVTLTPDGDGTLLVVEERGLPLPQVAAYGAGWQLHVEDLAAYLAGGDRCDARARWAELMPAYQSLEVAGR